MPASELLKKSVNIWRSYKQELYCQGHTVTHKKFTQLRALALVTLESKRPLIVVVDQ